MADFSALLAACFSQLAASAPPQPRVPVGQRAVSAAFLRAFSTRAIGLLSPYQLVNGVDGHPPSIKSHSVSTGLSLVETLMLAAQVTGDCTFIQDADGAPYFGSTSVFVSYGWNGTQIGQLKEAIESDDCGRKLYYWIDIFAVAQNGESSTQRANNSADVASFRQVVQTASATALFWSPIDCPAVLGRIWCLYEILETHKASKDLRLLLRPSDRDSLIQAVGSDDGRAVRFSLEAMSSINACAAFEEDWCRIHIQIEVELNPKSKGEFVPVDKKGNPSEGWLGNGPWVKKTKIRGKGVPPFVDYVYDEDSTAGEMDGSKDGHLVLDRLVKDKLYDTLNAVLAPTGQSIYPPPAGIVLEGDVGEVSRLFSAGRMILEMSLPEDAQTSNATGGTFKVTDDDAPLIPCLEDVKDGDGAPIQVTAACLLSDGRIAVGDAASRVHIWPLVYLAPSSAGSATEMPVTVLEPAFGNNDSEDAWMHIITALSESSHSRIVGLLLGGELCVWSYDSCKLVSRVRGNFSKYALCTLGSSILVGVDEDDEDEEGEKEEEEEEGGGSGDDEGGQDQESNEDEDEISVASCSDDDLNTGGCLTLWKFSKGDNGLELVGCLVNEVFENIHTCTQLDQERLAVASDDSASVGIVHVAQTSMEFSCIVEAPVVLPEASNVIGLEACRDHMAVAYRSGPIVLFRSDSFQPLQLFTENNVHTVSLVERKNDIVVVAGSDNGLTWWRVEISNSPTPINHQLAEMKVL